MKMTYELAMSEDGYIARENGDVSWLDEIDIDHAQTGIDELFASIDALVMGRKTYDFIYDYGSWPYEDKPSWIVTSTEIQAMDGAHLNVVSSVESFVTEANSNHYQHIWLLGGGKLAASFLQKGLITEINITQLPMTLGKGIPFLPGYTLDSFSDKDTKIVQQNGFRKIHITL